MVGVAEEVAPELLAPDLGWPGQPGNIPGESSENCWKVKSQTDCKMDGGGCGEGNGGGGGGGGDEGGGGVTWRSEVAAVLLRPLSGWGPGDTPAGKAHPCPHQSCPDRWCQKHY